MTFASTATRNESWDRRIRRADTLGGAGGAAAPLLTFYSRVLRAQKSIFDALDGLAPEGRIEKDASRVAALSASLLATVAEHGSEPLAGEARALRQIADADFQSMLVDGWHEPSDRDFFLKALLQPYGEWLAQSSMPIARHSSSSGNRCPRCGGAPQLAILSSSGGPDEGSSRQLQCARCLSTWCFPRVRCPGCGEDQEARLGYFQSPALDHVRLDVCDRCRRYIKTVDLGRLGLAVPLVDEVAAAPLDAWAHERGYEKIELNLLGL